MNLHFFPIILLCFGWIDNYPPRPISRFWISLVNSITPASNDRSFTINGLNQDEEYFLNELVFNE